ncbi:ABC transporter permease [Eubacteriaceae bacterium Marseille-Q4139]|nr:ABC transporter permease [Eubacteriaceae bacterium Marseille-Q4139]
MEDGAVQVKKRSQFQETWRRLKKNRMAMLGLFVITLLILVSIFADFIFDYNDVVIKQDTSIRLEGPSSEHWLGTDEFGRDILARLVHGSRVSLSVGVVAVTISLLIGGTLGAIAGFYGGKVDNVIMRFMDILLAVPSLLLSITIVSALGPSLINLMLAIGISSVPSYARIVRASVLTVKDQEFVEAARCIGANNFEIITSHIIPNCMAPIIVQVSLKVASAILSTSGLSFLGLGVKAPTPEWGAMLSGGRSYLRNAPHLCIFPGIAIIITILSLNLLGDGLRDALDPKLKK